MNDGTIALHDALKSRRHGKMHWKLIQIFSFQSNMARCNGSSFKYLVFNLTWQDAMEAHSNI